MTLVSDIIRDAYRESNLIAIGTEPSGAQEEEALRLLYRAVKGVYGNKAGEELFDLPVGNGNISRPVGFPGYNVTPNGSQFYVPANARLIFNTIAPLSVYLNPTPADGERFAVLDKSDNFDTNPVTVFANGRTIEGYTSTVLETPGEAVEYMYRADLGDWRRLSPVLVTDLWAFPEEFDDLFVILLAARLNPRNDVQLDGQSVGVLKDALTRFRSRYRQQRIVRSELGLLRLTGTRCQYSGWGSPEMAAVAFTTGRPYYEGR